MHAEPVKFTVTSDVKRTCSDSDTGSENAVCLSLIFVFKLLELLGKT